MRSQASSQNDTRARSQNDTAESAATNTPERAAPAPPASAPTASVPGITLLRPAMEAALDRLHPQLRLVASYHRGWSDAAGNPCEASGGKAVRPALALLSGLAAGAPAATALPGAVAVELVHDFSLLHDDVIDDDRTRRHRPTAWTVFGVPSALLTGDALVVLAGAVLTDVPGEPGHRASQQLSAALQRLMSGQTDDLAFETRLDVSFADYLEMAGGKTAALLSCSCAIGAALADAPEPLVTGLAKVGEHLGLAFQLVDDLLAMWGDPAVTGKPVLSDLRARKKSAPIACALEASGPGVERLRAYLAGGGSGGSGGPGKPSPAPDGATLRELAEVVEATGRQRVEQEARRQLALAERTLAGLRLPAEPAGQLLTIARYITRRDR